MTCKCEHWQVCPECNPKRDAEVKEIESVTAVGALVEARRVNGPWQRYNIYDSVSLAEDTKRRTDGAGIEVRVVPLYAAPVQAQERKPLSDKQISKLWSDAHNDTTDRMAFQVFARAIEAVYGIEEQP